MADNEEWLEAAQIAEISAFLGDLARCDISELSQQDLLEAQGAVARLVRSIDVLKASFARDLARRLELDPHDSDLARLRGLATEGQQTSPVVPITLGGEWP